MKNCKSINHALKVIMLLVICLTFSTNLIYAEKSIQQNFGFWVPLNLPKATYTYECNIDPENRVIEGSGMILIKNNSRRQMHCILMDWAINDYQFLELRIDGNKIKIQGSQEDLSKSPLHINLPEPLLPDHHVELELTFCQNGHWTVITDLKSESDSTVDRITMRRFLPSLWWGFPTSDDYNVKISIPSEYIIATSGYKDPASHYYRGQSIRNFGHFIGKGYQFFEVDVQDVHICCYYNNKSIEAAKIIKETVVEVIQFYYDYFGFYPYKQLNFVPGSAKYWGGYNLATSLAEIHSMARFSKDNLSHWQTMTIHEIAHMYWGEYVIEKDTSDWLWLGLGIYTQRLYSQKKEGLANSPHGYLT